MAQMGMQYPGDLRSNRRFSDIINGSQLHRFEVALHFELPRRHDDGQPAIDLDCALNHATPLEETAPLTHNDEFESPGFHLADAFGIRIAHGAFSVTTKHENGLELGVKWESTASERRSFHSGADEPEYEYDLDAVRHNEM